MGYFHLALAAALEDRDNPRALYVICMKLAEIHANHMPDPHLCQAYRDRAQSLRRVLAGEEDPKCGEEEREEEPPDTETGREKENVSEAETEWTGKCTIVLCDTERRGSESGCKDETDSKPESCEDDSQTSTERSHKDPETLNMDETDNNLCSRTTDGSCVDASVPEVDTNIVSHSYTDSVLTESFDTAREHISGSSDSTGTLQTDQELTEETQTVNGHSDSDNDTDKGRSSQTISIPVDHSLSDITHDARRHTEMNLNKKEAIHSEETNIDIHKIDMTHKDSSLEDNQSDVCQTETVNVDIDKADSVSSSCYYTEKDTAENADDDSEHMDLDHLYT